MALIYKLKIESIKNNNKSKKKQYCQISYDLFKISQKNGENKEIKNIIQNNIISFERNIDSIIENYKDTKKKNKNNIITYFFFSLFLNYQTINSRLIKYNKKVINKMYASIPYEYNLTGSAMKGYYAILISSVMRQDNRIRKIIMSENDLMELGMSELGKTIVFNPYIKSINYSKNNLFSHYFYYLIYLKFLNF